MSACLDLNLICESYGLDDLNGSIEYLHKNNQNLLKIKTSLDCFFLKKIVNKEQACSFVATENISENLKHLGFPVRSAYKSSNGCLVYIENKAMWLIYPWLSGDCIASQSLTLSQGALVTRCLAQIHAAAVTPQSIPVFNFHFEKSEWSYLIKALPEAAQQHLSKTIPLLVECYAVYSDYRASPASDIVVSHRDLHVENIIWLSDDEFHIIDWDLAGPIEAGEDLLYWAIDFALCREGINLKKLKFIIREYKKIRELKSPVSVGLLSAVMMNWLSWIEKLLKSFAIEKDDTLLQQAIFSLDIFKQIWEQRFYFKDLSEL